MEEVVALFAVVVPGLVFLLMFVESSLHVFVAGRIVSVDRRGGRRAGRTNMHGRFVISYLISRGIALGTG